MWERIDLPMPKALTAMLTATWDDHLPEVLRVPLAVVLWDSTPRTATRIPLPLRNHCRFLAMEPIPDLPPGSVLVRPRGPEWCQVAFWDAIFMDYFRECDAFLFLALDTPMHSLAPQVAHFPRMWYASGLALPIGCRRGFVWLPRITSMSQVPPFLAVITIL